jgi:propanediol dehydratase small subunit
MNKHLQLYSMIRPYGYKKMNKSEIIENMVDWYNKNKGSTTVEELSPYVEQQQWYNQL